MHSGTIRRRRARHEDVGGLKYERIDSAGSDDLQEPLLGQYSDDIPRSRYLEDDGDTEWEKKQQAAQIAWSQIFANVLAQWAQFFAALFAHRSWPGSLIFWGAGHSDYNELDLDMHLTPTQEEKFRKLQHRIEIPFDGTSPEHQESLRELWSISFPECCLTGLVSEQWKDMGWQGNDPSTDFRGGGFISLQNLIFFAKEYPRSFQSLLHKKHGHRAAWEYPFAVAGVNISFMLIQTLDLRSDKPKNTSGKNFIKLLEVDEFAFDRLFCVAFEMLDAQWLAMGASYMEFNEVLKATRIQLERELSLDDITCIQDLPAFNLLSS